MRRVGVAQTSQRHFFTSEYFDSERDPNAPYAACCVIRILPTARSISSCSWVQLSLIWRASYWPGSVYCGDDDEGLSITSGRRLYERATKATSDFDPIASGSSAAYQAASAATTSRNAMPGLSATARCAICVVGAMFQSNRPGQSIRRRKPHHAASLTECYAIEALERAHHRRTAPPTASAVAYFFLDRIES